MPPGPEARRACRGDAEVPRGLLVRGDGRHLRRAAGHAAGARRPRASRVEAVSGTAWGPSMNACDRFEREGLLRIEQGLTLDDHYTTCADCETARKSYERLRGLLSPVGSPMEPPLGWRDRVWAEIGSDHSRGRRSAWWPWS